MLDSCHPIIYVRGYAMSQGEIDDTTADPFNGFNVGSATYRAAANGSRRANKFVFESPVIRLMSDYGYRDVFADGLDLTDDGWDKPIPRKSIIIDRYYEEASELLGQGKSVPIDVFAKKLSVLVARVRELVVADPENGVTNATFRCYLVAHSMGGLVCRAFLQNPELDPEEVVGCVDKFFTYATPHNGIDVAGLNVPSFLGAFDMNNFNRKTMAKYLDLQAAFKKTGRVDWIPESRFPSSKVFCMIGSNRADYKVAFGLSRTFVGDGSDGLVKIDNASIWGMDDKGDFTASAAVGFCYRSHSGWFGIVNSEESYQNLTRFLFGDVRVDVRLEIDEVRLPAELKDNKSVKALYQFEVFAAPRGKRWFLTRRVAEEDSVACRTHEQLTKPKKPTDDAINLCTIFLSRRARVNTQSPTLSYRLGLNVRVPDYEVDGIFWTTKHYEGGSLFQDAVIAELTPPPAADGAWQVKMGLESKTVLQAINLQNAKEVAPGVIEIEWPINSMIDDQTPKSPGISGRLVLRISQWNTEYGEAGQ